MWRSAIQVEGEVKEVQEVQEGVEGESRATMQLEEVRRGAGRN